MSLEIQCQRAPWSNAIEVLILDRGMSRGVAAPLVFNKIEEGEALERPTLKLRNHAAQNFMD